MNNYVMGHGQRWNKNFSIQFRKKEHQLFMELNNNFKIVYIRYIIVSVVLETLNGA